MAKGRIAGAIKAAAHSTNGSRANDRRNRNAATTIQSPDAGGQEDDSRAG